MALIMTGNSNACKVTSIGLELLEMARGDSNKKVANSLVALSSAAVLAIYTSGYSRTRSAAQRLDAQSAVRRPAIPVANVVPAAPETAVEAKPAPVPVKRVEPTAVPEPVAPDPAPLEAPASVAALPEPEAAPEVPVPAPAPVPVAAPVPPPPPPATAAPVYKDGTYYGWGSSRHGDIQAAVVIQGGRIESATIAECRTRYSCSVIAALPPEVPQRQSPEVDYVSGATQSANAFYYAVVEALGKAK
jgi:uncharacterized protein with FMN-binding domain